MTTLAVARRLGRRSVGIELSEESAALQAEMNRRRAGPLLVRDVAGRRA